MDTLHNKYFIGMESTTDNINKTSSKFKPDGTPWFKNKNFERYWNVYNKCMIYAHKDVLSRCLETENNLAAKLYSMVKAPWPENFSDFRDTRSRSRSRCRNSRKRRKRRNKKKSNLVKETSQPSVFVLTDDDTLQVHLKEKMKIDDESSDIDDDYINFMKTSVMHRIKWNHVKELKIQSDDDLTQSLTFEQEEHPDIVREKEMSDMYGASAAQIHGMETAIQLSFDRVSTLHQPNLWPNIPLRLSF